MMEVKIIKENDSDFLRKAVNDFLQEDYVGTVLSISYTILPEDYRHYAMILYKID